MCVSSALLSVCDPISLLLLGVGTEPCPIWEVNQVSSYTNTPGRRHRRHCCCLFLNRSAAVFIYSKHTDIYKCRQLLDMVESGVIIGIERALSSSVGGRLIWNRHRVCVCVWRLFFPLFFPTASLLLLPSSSLCPYLVILDLVCFTLFWDSGESNSQSSA